MTGYVDHPIRRFVVGLKDGTFETVLAHMVNTEHGVLVCITIANGLPYATRGFAPGAWVGFVGSIPSVKEITDLKQRADDELKAREMFASLETGDTKQ